MNRVHCNLGKNCLDQRACWHGGIELFPVHRADLVLCLFSPQIEKMLTGIHAMYVISIITLLLTIIGVYGACSEKQWVLIVVSKEKNSSSSSNKHIQTIINSVFFSESDCSCLYLCVCVSVCSWNDPEQSVHDCMWNSRSGCATTGITKLTLRLVVLWWHFF